MTFNNAVSIFFLLLSSAALASGDRSLYQLPLHWNKNGGKTAFELKELQGSPVIASMAYTSCASACPLIVEKMKKVEAAAKARGLKPRMLLVSFNAKRDTPEAIEMFRHHHGIPAEWVFVTGDEPSVRTISMALGIKFYENPVSGEIQHDNRIVLLNPQGEIQSALNGLDADPKSLWEK